MIQSQLSKILSCSGCYFAGGLVGVYVEALTLTTNSLFLCYMLRFIKQFVHRWHHRWQNIEIWEFLKFRRQTKTTKVAV